jgi:hypothetical protein
MIGLGPWPGAGRFRLLIKKNTSAPRTMNPPTTPPAIPPIAPEERPEDSLADAAGVAPPPVLDEVGLSEVEVVVGASVVVGTGVVEVTGVVDGAVVGFA